MIKSDYLIIGSGIAGLSFALKASKNSSVFLVTKGALFDSSTGKAQGGICCVTDKLDSFEEHINDTLISGVGLCNSKMVERMVVEAPERIQELIALGAKFTKKNNSDTEFDLGLEGGHSKRRILHTKDTTGNEIENILIKNIKKHKNIVIYEEHAAVDLILDDNGVCHGAYVLNNKNNDVVVFESKITVLATGGAGKTYLYTTNPDVSTGDGIAMAYRAGADIANMEFVQFHPTCLYSSAAKSFLISEAVRGEGAVLKLKDGERFMEKYSAQKELAPRDIVARAIDNELKTSGEDFVYLDIREKGRDFIVSKFPNIYENCLKYGINITKDMIPVTPAAHFFCGGIAIDENGRTSVKNVYAIGEVSCSGVHGANRLASNSLLEGVVYANRAYKDSLQFLNKEAVPVKIKPIKNTKSLNETSDVFMQKWQEIRRLAWNSLGISRSNAKLLESKEKISNLKHVIDDSFMNTSFSVDGIELRNIACISEMIVDSAMLRKESRGLHFNADYPFMLPKAKDTVINIRTKAQS
ncbi:L-aspartate oxidase [Endomicrobiia bacterium]|nr:L-aspartate oxidase [Endomicrobiia bacterium]GHT71460.1 L-aspartate oxidase [Endomicrobiia bacterium]GHT76865.1 L-aspartate oxidase [Endomicrobiia bacterium]